MHEYCEMNEKSEANLNVLKAIFPLQATQFKIKPSVQQF